MVDDDPAIRDMLRRTLTREGWRVGEAASGRKGIALLERSRPALVLLDLMMPELDGFQVLQAMRGDGNRTPVLILSARGEEADKVRGFRLDADQYVTKPFGLLELLERIRSLLRRSGAALPESATISFGAVVVDPARRTVTRHGEPVQLTPKAFELLLALVRRGGAVATRVELLREVWGQRGDVLTRTVDSHMAELRRKLEDDPADPQHLLTVWKVGYRFRS